MKSLFSILCLYFSISVVAQQSTDFDFFKKHDFEKVILSKYSIKNKTLSLPSLNRESVIEEKEEKTKIFERTLTKKEINKLFKYIKETKKTHVLDANYDIKISFFNQNNEISQIVEISSFTQNIILKKEKCKKIRDVNPCLFLGSINEKFNRYILKLLSKKVI